MFKNQHRNITAWLTGVFDRATWGRESFSDDQPSSRNGPRSQKTPDPFTAFTASLAADAASLFRTWWQKDRIRSSPSAGKLLRLASGAILSINGTTVEVERRDTYETTDGAVLKLRCRSNDAESDLWVTGTGLPTIVWCCDQGETRLDPSEIEVWCEGSEVD